MATDRRHRPHRYIIDHFPILGRPARQTQFKKLAKRSEAFAQLNATINAWEAKLRLRVTPTELDDRTRDNVVSGHIWCVDFVSEGLVRWMFVLKSPIFFYQRFSPNCETPKRQSHFHCSKPSETKSTHQILSETMLSRVLSSNSGGAALSRSFLHRRVRLPGSDRPKSIWAWKPQQLVDFGVSKVVNTHKLTYLRMCDILSY